MSEPKRVLFLDDRSDRIHAALKKYPPPEYDLTLVCTVKECIKMISNEPRWDIISLDHDLGFEEFVDSDRPDCGMEVVRWMEKYCYVLGQEDKWPSLIIIHTSNFVAGQVMVGILRDCNKYIYRAHQILYERFEYEH